MEVVKFYLQKYVFRKKIKEINQKRSQNLKQVPQNFMKNFNIDDATMTSQLMASCRKINITQDHKLQS